MPFAEDRVNAGASRRMKPAAWCLLAIVAVALLVRCAALWGARDAVPILDEKLYLARAHALLDGKGLVGSYQSWVRHDDAKPVSEPPQYPGAYQPPGYVVFLASIMGVTGRSVLAVKIVQCVLSTLTVLVIFGLGRSWFGEGCGLLSAGICALYPNLIAFSHLLWSETLFILLLVVWLWLLTREARLPDIGLCVGAGVVLAMLMLTRSAIVYFLPVFGIWFVVVHRPVWRRAILHFTLMLVAAWVLVLPWTVRNYQVHGGFVFVDTNGPFNLWRGNTPWTFLHRAEQTGYQPPFEDIPLYPMRGISVRRLVTLARQDLGDALLTDLQIMGYAQRAAWEYIRGDPEAFVDRGWYKIVNMWNPTSFLIRHYHPKINAYGDVAPWIVSVVTWSAVLSYVIVMMLGMLGLVMSSRNPVVWLVLLLVLFYTALSVVAFGLTRYRLPLMPLIIILAAYAILALSRHFSSLVVARRRKGRPGKACDASRRRAMRNPG